MVARERTVGQRDEHHLNRKRGNAGDSQRNGRRGWLVDVVDARAGNSGGRFGGENGGLRSRRRSVVALVAQAIVSAPGSGRRRIELQSDAADQPEQHAHGKWRAADRPDQSDARDAADNARADQPLRNDGVVEHCAAGIALPQCVALVTKHVQYSLYAFLTRRDDRFEFVKNIY